MAKVKALISFAGIVSMSAGEVGEIEDNEILKDLKSAGYVEELGSKKTETVKAPAKKKKGDASED